MPLCKRSGALPTFNTERENALALSQPCGGLQSPPVNTKTLVTPTLRRRRDIVLGCLLVSVGILVLFAFVF
jgi:hypothetical protein